MSVPALADIQAAVKAAHDHAKTTGKTEAISRLNHLSYLLADRALLPHFGAPDTHAVSHSNAG